MNKEGGSRYSERWKVERKQNPLDRLPSHLSQAIIYGTPEESTRAYEELGAWERSTGIHALDAELEFLADARAQVGFGVKPHTPFSEIARRAMGKLLRRHVDKTK